MGLNARLRPTHALLICGVLSATLPLQSGHLLARQGGIVFESNWNTATGVSEHAVTDGGRWSNYWEFPGTGTQLLSVERGDGVHGLNALRVRQRGSAFAANLQLDDFLPPSRDYYLRFYMKNEDTSFEGDHVVTVDTFQYTNLTFMRKSGSPSGWRFDMSLYGCGFTYPIGHWGPARRLANGQWYRFEYHVDFIDDLHVQVHPRVYDAMGTQIFSDADFLQQDHGSAIWNGRSDWTLASYYGAGHAFCVNPGWVNDFGMGNNGQFGATATGLSWYFAAVQIRTDGWPGPVSGSTAAPPAPAPGGPPAPTAGLASLYPGDVGIESHPDVVFVERFEAPTLSDLATRWTDVLNGSTMTFSADVPPGSGGTRSLDIPWIGGGVSDGGHLYKELRPGIDDTLFVRYYIKYPATGAYNHTGIWMGGHNPPLPWPNPQAGIKPSGSDRFIAGAEQNASRSRFDHYNYWMNMRQSAGTYWGDLLLNNPSVRAKAGDWTCVEHMVTLNDPTSASNGQHAIWLDGVKVSHLGEGFPNGHWSGGVFTQDPTGSPFEGFRWRSDANLRLNWIWLLTYAPDAAAGSAGSIKFDHVVAARQYVGCLATGAG